MACRVNYRLVTTQILVVIQIMKSLELGVYSPTEQPWRLASEGTAWKILLEARCKLGSRALQGVD
jgi:hypothetical protein